MSEHDEAGIIAGVRTPRGTEAALVAMCTPAGMGTATIIERV